MWKPEYAEARREKYQSSKQERERRQQQCRTPEENSRYMKDYAKANPEKFRRTPEQQAKVNAARRAKYAQDQEYRNALKEKAKEWLKATGVGVVKIEFYKAE